MSANLPKAYKNGYQDFYGRNFIVTPDVLIPRPETEQLIDKVLSLSGKSYLPGVKAPARELPKNPIILDVGTGSGCIAITLAKELPEAKIYASDISKKALEIARKNAKNHGVTIPLIISHLLKNVNIRPNLIVANLPYVDENWDWLDKASLAYEPFGALFAKDQGLELIKNLISQSASRNIRRLIIEADPCQHDKIINYAKDNLYKLDEIRGYIVSLERITDDNLPM